MLKHLASENEWQIIRRSC